MIETSQLKPQVPPNQITFKVSSEKAFPLSKQQRPGSTSLIPSGSHFKSPSGSIYEATTTSFSSLPCKQAQLFALGRFVADVTSSCRIGSELIVDSETICAKLLFGTSTTKRRGKGKLTSPALPVFDSQITQIKESVTAQLLLRSGGHIGRLAPRVASSLGPLVFVDLIRVR